MEINTFVVVTTDADNRGVFAGVLESQNGADVVLSEARMVVYWDESTRGVVGLAKNGPGNKCRISPGAPIMELSHVTCVMACTQAAAERFRLEPWG